MATASDLAGVLASGAQSAPSETTTAGEGSAHAGPTSSLQAVSDVLSGKVTKAGQQPLEPGQATGMAKNIGAGIVEAGAGLAQAAVQPSTVFSQPLATGLVFAHDALAPVFGYDRFPKHIREALLGDVTPDTTVGGVLTNPGAAVNAIADVTGTTRPENVVPGTPEQGIARKMVSGAAGMAPFGPLAAAAGASGAFVGNAAKDYVPEWAQPFTEMLGNYAGQLGFHGLHTAGHAAVNAAAPVARAASPLVGMRSVAPVIDPDTGVPFVASHGGPLTAAPGDVAAAGNAIASQAKMTPEQLADTLKNAAPSPVPGVERTVPTIVADATGKPDLLNYQRQLTTGSADIQQAFDARHAQNVLAVTNATKGIAPADVGSAAGTFLRNYLDDLHGRVDRANAGAEATASYEAAGVGLKENGARLPTQQDLGAASRDQLISAQEKAYDEQKAGFAALPNNWAVNMTPVADAGHDMLAKEPGPGGSFHASEQKIYQDASQDLNGVVPFSQVKLLLSNVSDAMRQVSKDTGKESRPYARLNSFRNTLTDTLGDAADRSAAKDAKDGVPPDQSLGGQLAGVPPASAPASPRSAVTLPSGAVFDPDRAGASVAPGQRIRPSAMVPGLTENFGKAGSQQFSEQRQAYAIYKDKFRNGTVGDVLRSSGRFLGFKMPDSGVGGWLFRSGPKGAEAADDLVHAMGSREAALKVIGDFPALTLRNAAMRDGTLDLTKMDQWKRQYAGVLSKFPEIATKFQSAADATAAVDQAALRGKQAIDSFENSSLMNYLTKSGVADPQTAIQRTMSAPNPAVEARTIMRAVGGDDAARAGVQRNLVDWIVKNITGSTEVGLTGRPDLLLGKLNAIMQNPKMMGAVKAILEPSQEGMLRNVQAELQHMSRIWNATKLRGSPGTAADIMRQLKGVFSGAHGTGNTMSLIAVLLGEHAVEHLAGAEGFLGFSAEFATLALAGLRVAGLRTRNDVIAEALLNPKFGRLAAAAAVRDPASPANKLTRQRLVEAAIGASQGSEEEAKMRSYKTGTR